MDIIAFTVVLMLAFVGFMRLVWHRIPANGRKQLLLLGLVIAAFIGYAFWVYRSLKEGIEETGFF